MYKSRQLRAHIQALQCASEFPPDQACRQSLLTVVPRCNESSMPKCRINHKKVCIQMNFVTLLLTRPPGPACQPILRSKDDRDEREDCHFQESNISGAGFSKEKCCQQSSFNREITNSTYKHSSGPGYMQPCQLPLGAVPGLDTCSHVSCLWVLSPF